MQRLLGLNVDLAASTRKNPFAIGERASWIIERTRFLRWRDPLWDEPRFNSRLFAQLGGEGEMGLLQQ